MLKLGFQESGQLLKFLIQIDKYGCFLKTKAMYCYVGKSVFCWLYLYAPFWSHFSASPLCTEVTTLLNFSFLILIRYFVVFTTCGYMLTFVSVLLPLLVTEVPLPSTCWVLTVRTQEIQLIVVLVAEIYYSHIIRIHSQINEGKRSIRWIWEESLSVFPEGPHRVHSLPPALNEIKSIVFLTREAFWDLAIFIGGRWHIGTFFPLKFYAPWTKKAGVHHKSDLFIQPSWQAGIAGTTLSVGNGGNILKVRVPRCQLRVSVSRPFKWLGLLCSFLHRMNL